MYSSGIKRLKRSFFSFSHVPYEGLYTGTHHAQGAALLFSGIWSEYLLVCLKHEARFCCSNLLLTE